MRTSHVSCAPSAATSGTMRGRRYNLDKDYVACSISCAGGEIGNLWRFDSTVSLAGYSQQALACTSGRSHCMPVGRQVIAVPICGSAWIFWFCLDFPASITAPLGQNRQRGDPYLKNEAWRQRLQNLDKDSHGTASASDARTRLCSRRQSQMLHCVPAVAQRTSPLLLCRLHVLCLSTVTRHASKQMQMPSRREPAGCTDCSLNDSRKAVS